MNKETIDASDQFTLEGLKQLRWGQILGFKQEDGSVQRYKIVRLNRKSGICMMRPIKLYKPEDFGQDNTQDPSEDA